MVFWSFPENVLFIFFRDTHRKSATGQAWCHCPSLHMRDGRPGKLKQPLQIPTVSERQRWDYNSCPLSKFAKMTWGEYVL